MSSKDAHDQEVSSSIPLPSSWSTIGAARNEEEEGTSRGHPHSNKAARESKVRCTDFSSLKVPFPWRLWQLLEDSEKNGNESIVSWLKDGDGFSISNPYAFTNSIMKAYFALTTYDSFIQELQRYGFMQTTVELNDHAGKRRVVDVFRNPRYNRKEKEKSLAIRRRYVVQSFSLRLSAKKQKQDTKENVVLTGGVLASYQDSGGGPHQNQRPVSATLWSLSTTSSAPRSPTGATVGLNNQEWNIYKKNGKAPHGDARNVGVEARATRNPGLLSYNDINGNQCRDERSFYPSTTISASNGKVNRSSVKRRKDVSSSSLLPLLLDLNGVIAPHVYACSQHVRQANRDEENNSCLPTTEDYEGWDTTPTWEENHCEVHGIASRNLETNWSTDSWSLETMYKPTLAEMLLLSSSHFTTNTLCKKLDDTELQAELEKIIDEDVMESIFD